MINQIYDESKKFGWYFKDLARWDIKVDSWLLGAWNGVLKSILIRC